MRLSPEKRDALQSQALGFKPSQPRIRNNCSTYGSHETVQCEDVVHHACDVLAQPKRARSKRVIAMVLDVILWNVFWSASAVTCSTVLSFDILS